MGYRRTPLWAFVRPQGSPGPQGRHRTFEATRATGPSRGDTRAMHGFSFQKSEVDDFSGLIAQNSEEYNNKGGCKNKKVSAGVPSLGEVRPQHMCLASYFARVLAAERRKDENALWDPLFSGPPGTAFSGGLYFPTVHPNVHPNVHRNVHLGWTLGGTLGWTVGWTVGK